MDEQGAVRMLLMAADLTDDGLVLFTHILPVVILTAGAYRASHREGCLLLSRQPSPQVHALPAIQVVLPNVNAAAVAADLSALAGRGIELHTVWQLHGAAAAGVNGVPPLEGVLHVHVHCCCCACFAGCHLKEQLVLKC